MDTPELPSTAEHSLADRLLAEGLAENLVAAAHEAGLRGAARPHKRTLLRAALSGRLEALKVAGKWTTSAAAIVRWIGRQQRKRNSERPPARSVDAGGVLVRYRLGRDQEERP